MLSPHLILDGSTNKAITLQIIFLNVRDTSSTTRTTMTSYESYSKRYRTFWKLRILLVRQGWNWLKKKRSLLVSYKYKELSCSSKYAPLLSTLSCHWSGRIYESESELSLPKLWRRGKSVGGTSGEYGRWWKSSNSSSCVLPVICAVWGAALSCNKRRVHLLTNLSWFSVSFSIILSSLWQHISAVIDKGHMR